MTNVTKVVLTSIAAVVFLVSVIVLVSFRGYSVPSDMVAVRVGAGPFEAKKIKGDCIPSSTRGFFTNDDYEYFPTNEREWDATGQKGSDAKPFQSVTKDKVEMQIPITIRFSLRTDCETLQDFYIKYARRYGVEFDNDGSYNDEWLTVLRKLVADPSDQTLDRIIQGYNWQAVWNDPATKTEIETQLTEELRSDDSLLVQTAHKSYFDGITVLVGKPIPPTALAEAVAAEQTKVAQAQAEEAQAKADEAKAIAQQAVAKADATKQQEIINGYRLDGMTAQEAIRAYNEAQAIASGLNPWQPTYVVNSTIPAK